MYLDRRVVRKKPSLQSFARRKAIEDGLIFGFSSRETEVDFSSHHATMYAMNYIDFLLSIESLLNVLKLHR